MHFARTLRAAGLPVGPGKVIDAVQAVEAVGITNRAISTGHCTRSSSTGRTSGSCSTRRFTSSGAIPSCSRRCSRLVLPQMNVEMPRDEGAEMIRRLAEALHPHQQTRESPEEQVEIDAAMTFSDREQLRTMDFEKMSLEELARAKAAIARLRLPIHDIPTRRYRPRPARRPRRHARDVARGAALGRPHRTEAQEPAPPPAAAGRAVRHLRLDEPLQPRLSAFHAFGHQRPRPGLHLRVRHAADQHHAVSALSRCRCRARQGRRGGGGLVRRHAHRAMRARVQPLLVAPRAGPGRGRADDHRRARPRRRHRPGAPRWTGCTAPAAS